MRPCENTTGCCGCLVYQYYWPVERCFGQIMPHTCEECGEEFGTLSGFRLHDCPEEAKQREWDQEVEKHMQQIRTLERAENEGARRAASSELTAAIEQSEAGDHTAVYQLLAHYERHLTTEWNTDEDDNYDGFQRVFYGPAVTALDGAVVAEGWPFLLDVLDAYWPSVTLDFTSYPDHKEAGLEETDKYEAFPHISHVLTTVTGKQLVRTRRTAGVDAIPPRALEYQLFFHRHPGDSGGWIRSMSYGWGIGHPEHPVAAHLHTLVDGEYEIWASSAIEHAFHADQEAAATLLESVFADGLVSDPGLMLRGLASIARDSYPDQKGHWDWETIYPELAQDGFDWNDTVRQRLRTLIEETDTPYDLSSDWTFADLGI